MRELSELKSCLTNELGENFRHGVINNMPYSPMAVIYQDEGALQAKEFVDLVLQSIWGDKRQAIVQLVMDGENFQDAGSHDALSAEDVQGLIDEMYAADDNFRNMSYLRIFMILSTGFCETLEDFQCRYEQVRQIKELIPDGLLSTSIILLDESIKKKKTADAIRQDLRERLLSDSREYSSTILLSNRLSNGSLLAGKRIRENYVMTGWIVLLMNSVGTGYRPADDVFYPIGQNSYLTAAFSEITRPNRDICDIVLHTVLSWVDRQIRNNGTMVNTRMDIEDLYQRLSISGGNLQALEYFFRQHIQSRLPRADVFRFLPRSRPGTEDLFTKTFLSVDQECMGGCSAFLKQLPLFDQQLENDLSEYLRDFVRKNLSVAERKRVLTAANVQKLLQQLQPEMPDPKLRFDTYVQANARVVFIEWALPVLQSVLSREQKLSVEYTKEFNSILQEFQQGYFPDNPELERYYTDLTNDILEGNSSRLGERLLEDIGNNSRDREGILDSIRWAVEEIFSARDIFHTPLEQEMVRRMGQNPHDIHNHIYNMLFKDLDGCIRLKTAIALSEKKQITIVNQREEDGADTELYRSIQANVSEDTAMVYFDSCNGNSVKIIRFYSCDSSNLI